MDMILNFDELFSAMTDFVETTSFDKPAPADSADPDPLPDGVWDDAAANVSNSTTLQV